MDEEKRFKTFKLPDGSVTRLPKLPVSTLAGMLPSNRIVPATLDKIDEAIADSAVERFRRAQE